MTQKTKLDGLFALGQDRNIFDDEEKALWALRHDRQICDDDPEGWRLLSLHLAYKCIAGFPNHEELLRNAIINAAKKGKPKSSRGAKKKVDETLILRLTDVWKLWAERSGVPVSKRRDEDAFEALRLEYPELIKNTRRQAKLGGKEQRQKSLKRFRNILADARRKSKMEALISALKNRSR